MPDKHIPPDWLSYSFYWIMTIIAGAMGALVRQLQRPKKKITHIISDTICGSIFSMFGTEPVSQVLYHMFIKFDLVHKEFIMPRKLIGFSGFLCGIFGIAVMEGITTMIKKEVNQITLMARIRRLLAQIALLFINLSFKLNVVFNLILGNLNE